MHTISRLRLRCHTGWLRCAAWVAAIADPWIVDVGPPHRLENFRRPLEKPWTRGDRSEYDSLGLGLLPRTVHTHRADLPTLASPHSTMVTYLESSGLLKTQRIIRAMNQVDRACFTTNRPHSFEDSPQPIGWNATISAPSIHAICLGEERCPWTSGRARSSQ